MSAKSMPKGPARTTDAAASSPSALTPKPAVPRGRRPRHVPQRTCIGCKTTSAKRQFVRIVRTAAGRVEVDPTGKKAGRGAYLCRQRSCWETALAREAITRALKVALPVEDRATLAAFAAGLPAAAPDEPAGTS